MATAEQRNHAKAFLKKAEEYLASAEGNLAAGRNAPAADDAIHAMGDGLSAVSAVGTRSTPRMGKRGHRPDRRGTQTVRNGL